VAKLSNSYLNLVGYIGWTHHMPVQWDMRAVWSSKQWSPWLQLAAPKFHDARLVRSGTSMSSYDGNVEILTWNLVAVTLFAQSLDCLLRSTAVYVLQDGMLLCGGFQRD
jgi:hypothetical protein